MKNQVTATEWDHPEMKKMSEEIRERAARITRAVSERKNDERLKEDGWLRVTGPSIL